MGAMSKFSSIFPTTNSCNKPGETASMPDCNIDRIMCIRYSQLDRQPHHCHDWFGWYERRPDSLSRREFSPTCARANQTHRADAAPPEIGAGSRIRSMATSTPRYYRRSQQPARHGRQKGAVPHVVPICEEDNKKAWFFEAPDELTAAVRRFHRVTDASVGLSEVFL